MNRLLPAAVMCLAVALPLAGQAQDVLRAVRVSGSADVAAPPDMATLQVGVSRHEDSARAAMDGVAAALGPVLETLSEAAIPPRDIQTTALSLTPVFRYDANDPQRRPIADGFRAATTLTVRVRELAALGGLIDALVDEGANELQGLSLGMQTPERLFEEAQKAAIQDAMAKAALYANEAGVRLGQVISIAEAGSRPVPEMIARNMAMDAAPVAIAGGEVSLTARVDMVIGLAD
ncbi:MAG: SIMPL domain-containing protein [Qingshengfaniella sp.]